MSAASIPSSSPSSATLRIIEAEAAAGVPVTVLHIGAESTTVISGSAAEPATTLALALGAQKTAREFFRRSPPTPLEMENAIVTVEDEVVRALSIVKKGSSLFCADAAVREIAVLAGVPESARMILSLDAMERTFGRLAAVAEGRPAVREGLPDNTEFAATLLILREFMHHLRFFSITVLA